MFDLPRTDFPTDAAALQDALERSVHRRVQLPEGHAAVVVEMEQWPRGARLDVDLSGGRLDLPGSPAELRRHAKEDLKPPVIVTDRAAGPSFETFGVRGDPVIVGTMQCRLILEGQQVQFDFGRDENGAVVMAPAAGHGSLIASVPKQQLVDFIRQTARDAAAEKGVALEQVDVRIAAPRERELSVEGTMRGRKKLGFLSASFAINFAGRIEVDDELVGRVRELDLHGQGMVLDMLLGLLRPKLEQIKSRPLPLREMLGSFVPAALELRDLTLTVDEQVKLSARFGPESETR